MKSHPPTTHHRRKRRAPDEAAQPTGDREAASPAQSLELLRNPMASRAARGAAALGLQRAVGNAQVARELAQHDPDVQRNATPSAVQRKGQPVSFQPHVTLAPAQQRPQLNQEITEHAAVTNASHAPKDTVYEWSWAGADAKKLETIPPAPANGARATFKAKTIEVGESEASAQLYSVQQLLPGATVSDSDATVQSPPMHVMVAPPKAKFKTQLKKGDQVPNKSRPKDTAFKGDTLTVQAQIGGIKKPPSAGLKVSLTSVMVGDGPIESDAGKWVGDSAYVWQIQAGGRGDFAITYAISIPGLPDNLTYAVNLKVEDYNKKRFEELQNVLNTIPTGQQALELAERYKVGVVFQSGGGSVYHPDSNTMTIDDTEKTLDAALTFVHEMNHARYQNEGIGGNLAIDTLARTEYIKKMVEEEAEGTVKSIEAKIELEGTTIDVSKTGFPLEQQYRKAFKAAVDVARAKDPDMADDELKQIGRAAGKERVIKGFMRGEVTTSNTNEAYPRYYGKGWDKSHKAKK